MKPVLCKINNMKVEHRRNKNKIVKSYLLFEKLLSIYLSVGEIRSDKYKTKCQIFLHFPTEIDKLCSWSSVLLSKRKS